MHAQEPGVDQTHAPAAASSAAFIRSGLRSVRALLHSHPYWIIFGAALVVRLVFLTFMLSQLAGSKQLAQLTPDVRFYTEAAGQIREQFDWQSAGIKVFGPGYPAWLALVGLLVGTDPVPLLLVQILVSALGAVLLADFAWRLTGDRAVSLVAGWLHAFSVASISFANVLLSDAVFFVLVLAGLEAFLLALARSGPRWSVMAGLLLAVATLTRSVAQFFFIILPLLALVPPTEPAARAWPTLRRRAVPLILTTAVMLAVAGSWAIRNRMVYGVTYLAEAAPAAMMRMSAVFQQDALDIPTDSTFRALGQQVAERKEAGMAHDPAFVAVARESFFGLIRAHPLACARAYFRTVNDGTHTDRGLLTLQLPESERAVLKYYAFGWRYRTAALSAVAILLLVYRRRFRLALFLGAVYMYFGLLSGLNPWQGNRVFYPGQISWTILLGFAMRELLRGIRPLLAMIQGRLR